MLFINNIFLTQFRNYLFQQFNFNERVVAICGTNGSGKTNLLDAVHFLCFTKSYFSKPDIQSSFQNTAGFRIEGNFLKEDEAYKLICILRENGRKEFSVNDEIYKRFSNHIGRFSCVFIAPDDVALISGTSEERRRFLDTILSQLSPDYLKELIEYNKILLQRNSLLKAAAEYNRLDETLLDTFDEQLADKAQNIFEQRKKFLNQFLPIAYKEYNNISGKNDDIVLRYDSQLLNVSMKKLLSENRQRDLYLQRTGAGIHKDDMEIMMNNQPFKTMASQGQRKSLLFALKFAEFNILKEQKKYAPVLLLDDVFEKLDEERMNNLLHKVCVEEEAQVFITDTHKERLQQSLNDLKIKYQFIELSG